MSRGKPHFTPQPRIWTEYQVACRLGRSVQWFRNNLAGLRNLGFPQRDEVLGGYDGDAIEYWLDARAGLTQTALDPITKGEWEEWQP